MPESMTATFDVEASRTVVVVAAPRRRTPGGAVSPALIGTTPIVCRTRSAEMKATSGSARMRASCSEFRRAANPWSALV